MINRPEHDNSAFRAPTPDCNPNDERNERPNHFQETHKMKTPSSSRVISRLLGSFLLKLVTVPIIKKNAEIGIIILGGLIFGGTKDVYASTGALSIINGINSPYSSQVHETVHRAGVSEGYDSKDYIYFPMFNPSGIKAKIVSILEEETEKKELEIDARPVDSTTAVNLELAIHKQGANWGDPVTIDSENELWCSLPLAGAPYFYNFGNKPITLWERNIIDPNNNPNDPNNYTLSFMADIRESIDKSDFYPGGRKTARLILSHLSITLGSEVPYIYAQTNFTIFSGDFNFDGKVNLKDYAYWADCDPIADISGPNGLPDGEVDFYDLSLYNRDYLKDSNDPNTWRDFPYPY